MSSPAGGLLNRLADIPHDLADFLHSFPNDHPLQIALRTYALSLSLALSPSLLPFVTSAKARQHGLHRLKSILQRELGITGFAFAMTVGVSGGAALRRLWQMLGQTTDKDAVHDPVALAQNASFLFKMQSWLSSLKDSHKTFLANVISSSVTIALLHSRRPLVAQKHMVSTVTVTTPGAAPHIHYKGSRTLELTLLIFVRAMDAVAQMTILKRCEMIDDEKANTEERKRRAARRQRVVRTRIDALVFWACSARIMWCFFYQPDRLPRSYNKWIMTVANIDSRLLTALRAIRSGAWSYRRHHSVQPDLISTMSRDLGYPERWGDLTLLPAYGGAEATAAWKVLGVQGRDGVGGIPCELAHGSVTGGSCTSNIAIRGAQAFAEALIAYLPVHFVPILLTRPHSLFRVPQLIRTLLSVLRSASFLSAFVTSIWTAVCLTRTHLLARMFPWISHDVWDGPFGCTFIGSLVCGGSIWIEQGRRRGEIALYVLPRAIRACLPVRWLMSTSRAVQFAEQLAFILSLSSILTAAIHRPDILRGLSRWTVAFVMNGPNAGFWKKKREDRSVPSTPAEPTPPSSDVALS